MNTFKRIAFVVSFNLVLVSQVYACSCAYGESRNLANSYARSDAVFAAKWKSAAQSPEVVPGGGFFVEDVQFIVTEVFKGKRKVGEVVSTRSEVGMGVCGLSVRNEPVWLEKKVKNPGDPSAPASLSESWLIFEEGEAPVELSRCARSRPLNQGGDEDVEELRKRAKIVPKAASSGGRQMPNRSLERASLGEPRSAAQLQR